jgi:hypothetical protein
MFGKTERIVDSALAPTSVIFLDAFWARARGETYHKTRPPGAGELPSASGFPIAFI